MTETIQRINPKIWIFAIVLIGFVVLQAAVFLKIALNFNKKHHVLTSQEVKDAVKTGAVSVIGPALSVVLLAMTLITFVGPATTFMRVGVIGSASYELNIANTAADAIGVSLGTEAVTESVFTLCLFGMILASAPYFLNCFISLKPLDMAMKKAASKKISFTTYIGLAAAVGLIGRNTLNQMKSTPHVVAIVVSVILTLLMKSYIKRTGKKGLNNWILVICLIAGMTAAVLTKKYM